MIVGSAARPKDGEKVSGDAIVVRQEREQSLFAVIDALGHGPAAYAAAERAVAALHEAEFALSAAEIMMHLHQKLRGSRGAAITMGVLRGKQLELTGVGNVEVRCRYGYIPFAPMPGIVGISMRKPRVVKVELPMTIRIFVFTDGISRRLDASAPDDLGAGEACEFLLGRHGSLHDDATILCIEPRAR